LRLTTSPSSCAECHGNLGAQTSWNFLGHTGSVTGLLYLYLCCSLPFKICSEVEGRGLRLVERNGLLDEALGVSKVDDVGLSEKTVGELEVATVDLLETLYILKRNSLNLVCISESRCPFRRIISS